MTRGRDKQPERVLSDAYPHKPQYSCRDGRGNERKVTAVNTRSSWFDQEGIQRATLPHKVCNFEQPKLCAFEHASVLYPHQSRWDRVASDSRVRQERALSR